MMKKYIFLTILLLFTLPLVVHADEDKNINDLQLKKPIEIVSKDETKSYENMNIDVQVNKDGYYSLMSNTEIITLMEKSIIYHLMKSDFALFSTFFTKK